MAQDTVQDIKLDYSREYQPLTEGPGKEYFTFRTKEGAGGKRVASVAYLLQDGEPGAYRVELEHRQAGKGRLSAFNQSLSRTLDQAVLEGLESELLRAGWRQSRDQKWLSPETVQQTDEDELLPINHVALEREPEQVPDPPHAGSRADDPPYLESLISLIRGAEDMPNGYTMLSLPNGLYVVVMRAPQFYIFVRTMTGK